MRKRGDPTIGVAAQIQGEGSSNVGARLALSSRTFRHHGAKIQQKARRVLAPTLLIVFSYASHLGGPKQHGQHDVRESFAGKIRKRSQKM